MKTFDMGLNFLAEHKMISFVIIAVLFDVFIGVMRAIKEKRVNSSIGIDGAVRKISLLGCIVVMVFIDFLVDLNVVGWIPEQFDIFGVLGVQTVGASDLFGLLFVSFEILSIIKNWALLGLPMFKGINDWVTTFLETVTDEMPTTNKNSGGFKK